MQARMQTKVAAGKRASRQQTPMANRSDHGFAIAMIVLLMLGIGIIGGFFYMVLYA